MWPFSRSKAGQAYDGVVVYSFEAPEKVPFQGHYGVNEKGEIDPKCPVRGNSRDGWKRVK
jgi:hypothetical protein